MIVKIDVDGVIRDVMSAICALNARDFGEVVSPADIVRYDFSGLFHKGREQFGNPVDYFFLQRAKEVLLDNVSCFPRVKEAIDLLRSHRHRVIIVTYQLTTENMRYTLEFLSRHGIVYDDIMFTKHKYLVHGHYLIDDCPDCFLEKEKAERIIIDAPYNRYLSEGCGRRFASLYEAAEYICQVEF